MEDKRLFEIVIRNSKPICGYLSIDELLKKVKEQNKDISELISYISELKEEARLARAFLEKIVDQLGNIDLSCSGHEIKKIGK